LGYVDHLWQKFIKAIAGEPPRYLPGRAPPGRRPRAPVALQRPDARTKALGDTIAELLVSNEFAGNSRGGLGAERSLDLGEGHPLLLNLGEPGGFDITPWADRVRLIDATYNGRGSFRRSE
jgi:hypothetical protein